MSRFARYVLILAAALTAAATYAEDQKYSTYDTERQDKILLRLDVGVYSWKVTFFPGEDREIMRSYDASQVKKGDGMVQIGDEIKMSDDSITSPYGDITMDEVGEVRAGLAKEPYITSISFVAVDTERRHYRFRRTRDRLSFWDNIAVEEGKFVRGSVVAFFGNVEVYGEINRDVLAIFGNITVGKEAVIRGDAIAVNGTVELLQGASVYGSVTTAKGEKTTHRHRARRWKRLEGHLELTGKFYYNRVDGLGLLGGLKYEDPDSLLPTFGFKAGYAFGSERWRYQMWFAQTVLRGPIPVQFGGEFYRLLESDDDKLLGDGENTLYALCFNEDWKDYYESEGGYGFVRLGIGRWNRLEIGYLAENQNWLDAHPRLWSLFGAKEFRGNFSSVPYDTLRIGRDDFDDRFMTSFRARVTYDTRDDEDHPRQGWYGITSYEYCQEDWKGDFDFERYEVTLRRYQPLHRYILVNLAAAYGRIQGDRIPLNRQFYLGGLGTLYGYRHKEYRGNEYIEVSLEYGFRIPRSDLRPFVQYDGGKIGVDELGGGESWKSAMSIGIYFEEDYRIMLSKRLDEGDQDPIFYARFSALF